MTISFPLQARTVITAALLVMLGGCQTFSGMMASFKPAATPSSSSPIATDTTPSAPITKEQKIELQMAVARSYENEGNSEQAIEVYRDVIKKDSRYVEAYHRLAILYDTKGEPQKAKECYLTAIKTAPKNAELYCDFGYSCYLQRNWAEAGVNLRRALELRPEFARAHTNLGLLLARNYHAPEALAEFSKAGCDEAGARCNLAFAMTLEERWQEARQQYELALAANPNASTAKKGLAALEAHAPKDYSQPRPAPVNVASQPAQLQLSQGELPRQPVHGNVLPPPVPVPSQADLARVPAPGYVMPLPVPVQPLQGELARLPAPGNIAPQPAPVQPLQADLARLPAPGYVMPPPVPVQPLHGDLARLPPPGNIAPPPVVQTSLITPDVARF